MAITTPLPYAQEDRPPGAPIVVCTPTTPAIEVVTYRPSGEGRICPWPCILVHGAAHAAACFARWGGELARMGITTHALSLRGHGGSDPVVQPRLADYVHDVRTVYEFLGVAPSQSLLLGHSMGGFVAQYFARQQHVGALVLLGSVAPHLAISSLRQIARSLGVPTVRLVGRNALEMFNDPDKVRRALLEPDADDATVQCVLDQLCRESDRAMLPLFGATFRRFLPLPRLRTSQILLLAGDKDGCFPQRAFRASAQRLGRRTPAHLRLIPNGPHDLMLAQEAASRQAVNMLGRFCYAVATPRHIHT